MKHKETHLTQEQLIEKLAQNRIDVKRSNVYLLVVKVKRITLLIQPTKSMTN